MESPGEGALRLPQESSQPIRSSDGAVVLDNAP
jgi:hypothetical protein